MSSTSVISAIRACVGSTCEVTTRGLRWVRPDLAKTQTRCTKAEIVFIRIFSLGLLKGSRPLTRCQKRVLPGIPVLGRQSAASSTHEPAHGGSSQAYTKMRRRHLVEQVTRDVLVPQFWCPTWSMIRPCRRSRTQFPKHDICHRNEQSSSQEPIRPMGNQMSKQKLKPSPKLKAPHMN